MKNQVTIVGCDLHDRSLLLKIAAGMDTPQQRSFVNDCQGRHEMIEMLLEFARREGSRRIVFVYEASGQGYGLHDLLTDQGIAQSAFTRIGFPYYIYKSCFMHHFMIY